jgi:hypothetical protein
MIDEVHVNNITVLFHYFQIIKFNLVEIFYLLQNV